MESREELKQFVAVRFALKPVHFLKAGKPEGLGMGPVSNYPTRTHWTSKHLVHTLTRAAQTLCTLPTLFPQNYEERINDAQELQVR
jgi:hypothetical protein